MPIRLFIFLLILTACNTAPGKQEVAIKPGTVKASIDTLTEDTPVFHRDTFKINGQVIIQLQKNDRFDSLLTLKGDAIINPEEFYVNLGFPDIDKDGYKDIRLYIFSNTPNQCDTWLFNKTDSTYKKIENADLDFVKLAGTNYYYSYNRAGCADMTWQSHLLKIENWKEVDIGEMNTNGCGDKFDGIKLFRIKDSVKVLVERLPLPKFNNNARNNKWAYLKNYWQKIIRSFSNC